MGETVIGAAAEIGQGDVGVIAGGHEHREEINIHIRDVFFTGERMRSNSMCEGMNDEVCVFASLLGLTHNICADFNGMRHQFADLFEEVIARII